MRHEYRTPGTNLWWGSVAAWCRAAHQIDARRASRHRNAALVAHAAALPRALIDIEENAPAIDHGLELLKYGPPSLRRPSRGDRADHPTTAIIMWLANRRAVLARLADDIPEGDNYRAIHGAGD